jgi:oligopeptide transport system substrate-binding protein
MKLEMEPPKNQNTLSLTFHPSFYQTYEKLQKWIARYPGNIDSSMINDLFVMYLLASKKFLDHRNTTHLMRVVLSIHLMKKKLLREEIFLSNDRPIEIRWMSTKLQFPFSSKSVMSCLVGFSALDKYELFDEENIVLTLQKHLPGLKLVKESSYQHVSQHTSIEFFYFEIEKKDGTTFSLQEQNLLREKIEEKVKNSIQMLSPALFVGNTEEEAYKNILVLNQEIQSLYDLPQACINLDQQTGNEIIFRVTLVYVSPFHRFSLKDRFLNCKYVLQRSLIVRQLEDHPVEAHIFHIHLSLESSLLKSDGSLDFYAARQKVTALIMNAIGEFRDYNGGIIIKQQELFQGFKERFPDFAKDDPGLMETFFYSIMPLEKQAVLDLDSLSNLFSFFIKNQHKNLPEKSNCYLKINLQEQQVFLTVVGEKSSLSKIIFIFLNEQSLRTKNIAYNLFDIGERTYFNCLLLQEETADIEKFILDLQDFLDEWNQKLKNQRVLRIATEIPVVSLDSRVGGEAVSGNILKFLFEGLTRCDQEGNIENALAQSIEISSDLKQYVFKLRKTFWNDGSLLTAYDFEYAWKKILSPESKTAFADFFFPIKNAREAKAGIVSSDQIGIEVLDNRTLKVELVHPAPHFLQYTALPLYSPVNRLIDQQNPQWPYQSEKNYPCNGPYQLKINLPNQGFQLIRNPYYWDADKISLDQIFITHMEPAQALRAFNKKEIDWIGHPFGSWHAIYSEANPEAKLLSFPNNFVYWFVFNTSFPLFNHRKIRQAFAHAIHRSQIIDHAFMPLKKANSPLEIHENTEILYPEFDAEKGRQLLHEGLDELGMSFKDLIPLTLNFGEKGLREYTAICLKKQFHEFLGIECELKPLPWNEHFNKMASGNFQLGIMPWTSWVNDPIYTLNAFRFAKQGINWAKWEHPEFQEYLYLSDHETDPSERANYLLNAEKILCREMPIIPIFYLPSQALVPKDLQVPFHSPTKTFNVARSYYTPDETETLSLKHS